MKQVQDLTESVESQQQIIHQLQNQGFSNPCSIVNLLNTLKSPPILVFIAKPSDCTSTKVEVFISSVRRAGRLSNNVDQYKLLQLPECHLQDRASAWITRLEDHDEKPVTFTELQRAMVKEFVSSYEKSRAQLKLVTLQMRRSLDKHIEDFTNLVKTCKTPATETFAFYFM